MTHLCLRLSLIIGLMAGQVFAQEAEDRSTRPRIDTVGIYGGIARHSLVGTRLGKTPERDHLLVGIRIPVISRAERRWTVAYLPEILPVFRLSNNPTYERVTLSDGVVVRLPIGVGAVWGLGVSPLAVEARAYVRDSVGIYGGGSAGVVWFTRAIPISEGRSFNYAFDVGGGFLWQWRRRFGMRVGYKFHHLSNRDTAPANPGIDGGVYVVGVDLATRE